MGRGWLRARQPVLKPVALQLRETATRLMVWWTAPRPASARQESCSGRLGSSKGSWKESLLDERLAVSAVMTVWGLPSPQTALVAGRATRVEERMKRQPWAGEPGPSPQVETEIYFHRLAMAR